VSPPPADQLETLAGALAGTVPDGVLTVDRDRSLSDRLAGRPGRITKLELVGPELTLTLAQDGAGRISGQAVRVVRRVVISRQEVSVRQWLDLLAGQLHALSAVSAADDAAVVSMLAALGVQEPAADVAVLESDVEGGLHALPARLAGRLPVEAEEATTRICALLLEALPRVSGGGEQEYLVRRAATDYLPRTLRTYLSLPTDWARTTPIDGSRTAADVLLSQLAALEQAARSMLDAALAADGDALLANGRFLADRFPGATDGGAGSGGLTLPSS
jgi:hypothetical protein